MYCSIKGFYTCIFQFLPCRITSRYIVRTLIFYKVIESEWVGAIEKKIGWVSIFLCEMMHHWLHITLRLKSIGFSGLYSGSVRLNTFPCAESKDNILSAAPWFFACGLWGMWRHDCMTGLWWTNTRYQSREGSKGHLSTSLSLFMCQSFNVLLQPPASVI